MAKGGLNNRQRVFVEEYLRCWNASEAVRRAGYKGKPNVRGAQLLANVSIAEAIAHRLSELQMSANEVLVRLTEQARSSMADFVDPRLNKIDLVEAERRGKLHLIKSFRRSTGKTETVAIELYDAQAALVTLGKHLKLFAEETEHKGELVIRYVNDWRNPATDATSRPALGDAAGETVQPVAGGAPVAQDDDVHVDLH